MKSILSIIVILALSAAMGLGVAWYIRPIDEGPVVGPGFDPNFVPAVRPEGTERDAEGKLVAAAHVPTAHELLVARNQAALDALDRGDIETAVAELKACVEAEPDNAVFRRNLAETLARLARGLWTQGDRQAAIWKLEEALEVVSVLPPADQRPDLAKLLERWKREFGVEGDFWQDTSQHFELSYDARHDDLLHGYQDVIDRAENAYADLRDFFGFDPVFDSQKRLRITLYRRENFSAVTGLESWAGGAFDGTVRLPVSDLTEELHSLDLLLRHELAHAFVDAKPTRGPVPGWLNEGLAQYLSGEAPLVKRRAKEVLAGGALPLASLTGTFSGLKDTAAVGRAYTQSLIAVDAIAERYGERLLSDLLDDLCEEPEPGSAPASSEARLEAAFARRTGWTLPELVKEAVANL